MAALDIPPSNAIQDYDCAWGHIWPVKDEEFYRARAERGYSGTTSRATVLMTRPQKYLPAEGEFRDPDLAATALRDDRAVVVRVMVLTVEPEGGGTSTDDYVIGRNDRGEPVILTMRGLLTTD